MRRTATASNSARQGQLGAKRRRVAREPDDSSSGSAGLTALSIKGKEGNRRLGAPFQNLQRFMVSDTMASKGGDGFMRARSSGKTGAPFSHLPTGGRAGARRNSTIKKRCVEFCPNALRNGVSLAPRSEEI